MPLGQLLSIILSSSLINCSSAEFLAMQSKAMHNFIEYDMLGGTPQALREIQICARFNDPNDACHWRGVRCEEDVVTGVSWTLQNPDLDKITLGWLPNTVTLIRLHSKHVNEDLITRRLPIATERFQVLDCGLSGCPDLTTLPPALKSFDVHTNNLCGTVLLTKLPEGILYVNLQNNAIVEVIVRNDALPDCLERVAVSLTGSSLTCLDGDKVDSRVYDSQR